MGLTGRLPRTIAITDARQVQDDFDPRRASAGKRYRYLILSSPHRDPLLRDRVWHLWGDLDVNLMRAEAAALVGTHDFAAFRAADCERETTVRTIFRLEVLDHWQGRDDLIAVEVEGTAFLKNMVRVIVGTLVDVGRGRLPVGTVKKRLVDLDRTLSGMTAPAQGLYLDEVFIKDQWRVDDDPLHPCPPYAARFLTPDPAVRP
jgi:tRNA pseudouridine38-40 synthase